MALASTTNQTVSESIIFADTYVDEVSPNTNHGADSDIQIRKDTNNKYGFVGVNLSTAGLTAEYVVDSVLKMTTVISGHNDTNISFYYCDDTDGWPETGVTWNNWSTYISNCEATPFWEANFPANGSEVEHTIENLTQKIKEYGEEVFTIQLKGSYNMTSGINARFASSDRLTGKPLVEVSMTDECFNITHEGTYSVMNDFYNVAVQKCILMHASNVDLDLNNKDFNFSGNTSAYSALVTQNSTRRYNHSIYNSGLIEGFNWAIDLRYGGDDFFVENITSEGSSIYLQGLNSSAYINNIDVDDANANVFTDDAVILTSSIMDSLVILSSNNVNISDVFIDGPGISDGSVLNFGISLLGSSDVFLDNVSIDLVGTDYVNRHAIKLSSSSNVVLQDVNLISGHHIWTNGSASTNVSVVNQKGNVSFSTTPQDCFIPIPNDYYEVGSYDICAGDYYFDLNGSDDYGIMLGDNVSLNMTGVNFIGSGNGSGIYSHVTQGPPYPSQASVNQSVDGGDLSNFGTGMTVVARNSDFSNMNFYNNTYGFVSVGSIPFLFVGSSNVDFENVNASNNGRGGFVLFITQNINFNNSEFSHNGYGLELGGDDLPPGMDYLGNASAGGIGVSQGVIDSCVFSYNKDAGLAIVQGDNNTVLNTDFIYNEGFGLSMFGNDLYLDGNNFSNNNMTGFIYSGTSSSFENNYFVDNGDGNTILSNGTYDLLVLVADSLGVNLTELLQVSDSWYYSGAVNIGSFVSGTDTWTNNTFLDNWDYGLFYYDLAQGASLYDNLICNNSQSGSGLTQVVSLGPTVHAEPTSPYNNDYCDNNPLWFQQSRSLQLNYTPTDSTAVVKKYSTQEVQTPFAGLSQNGYKVYFLSQYTISNTTTTVDTPYQYQVYKPGYIEQQGLLSMAANTELLINLVPGYQPSSSCPENGTGICNLMVESGAGLGSFIQFIGESLPLLLLILMIISIVGAIGFSFVAVIKYHMNRY